MIDNCRLIDLPRIDSKGGSLTFVENDKHIPFQIRRVYFVYDLTQNAERGGHAHRVSEELAIAISGSFDVLLDDGFKKRKFTLNRRDQGLYMPGLIWRTFYNFSDDAAYLNLSSVPYDPQNYLTNYDEFISSVRAKQRTCGHHSRCDGGMT